MPFGDIFKLIFDENYRGKALQFGLERALPTLAGLGILIVGIAFVLAGSTAGRAAGTVIELAATKGGSLVKGLKNVAT